MNSLTMLIQTIAADPDAYAIQKGTVNTAKCRWEMTRFSTSLIAKVVSATTIMGGHGKLTGPQFQYAEKMGFVRQSPTLGSDYFDIIGIGKLRSSLWRNLQTAVVRGCTPCPVVPTERWTRHDGYTISLVPAAVPK
jgi:hypothetical protein